MHERRGYVWRLLLQLTGVVSREGNVEPSANESEVQLTMLVAGMELLQENFGDDENGQGEHQTRVKELKEKKGTNNEYTILVAEISTPTQRMYKFLQRLDAVEMGG